MSDTVRILVDGANVAPPFTEQDAKRAFDEWRANCGPVALAAIVGMTLDQVRPHMGDFESKAYTNPALMFDVLKGIGAKFSYMTPAKALPPRKGWPRSGLVRIQWEGPWTLPDATKHTRHRHTHWVGGQGSQSSYAVFDVTCMNNGTGWCSLQDWISVIAPHLMARYPRASGRWHITHSIEIEESKHNGEKR